MVNLFLAEMTDGMGEVQSWAGHRGGGIHYRATNASTAADDDEQDSCRSLLR